MVQNPVVQKKRCLFTHFCIHPQSLLDLFFPMQVSSDVFYEDEDALIKVIGGADVNSEYSTKTSLLDVNQLLESVCRCLFNFVNNY